MRASGLPAIAGLCVIYADLLALPRRAVVPTHAHCFVRRARDCRFTGFTATCSGRPFSAVVTRCYRRIITPARLPRTVPRLLPARAVTPHT